MYCREQAFLVLDTSYVIEIIYLLKPLTSVLSLLPAGHWLAGKTTLLALLRGQAHYAYTSGVINVNGIPVRSLVDYREQVRVGLSVCLYLPFSLSLPLSQCI